MKTISQIAFVLSLAVIVAAITFSTPVSSNAATARKGKSGGPRVLDDVSCPTPTATPDPEG